MAENACQGCDLCCDLLSVPALRKGRNVACRHIGPAPVGGCTIYRKRPRACGGFECIWLESQRRTDAWKMGPDMRPDQSHVVMGPPRLPDRKRLYVHVDPRYPDAWRQGRVGEYLRFLVDERGIELVIFTGEVERRINGDAMLTGTVAEFEQMENADAI